MEFNELLDGFAKRHNVADLVASDNAAALDIDGIIVIIVAKDDKVTLSADIGEEPAEGAAAFADLLLEANLNSDAFFAKTPESGMYIMVRRLVLQTLDDTAFDSALEAFVNRAEAWRKLLADFRPAAAAAAEAAKEDATAFGAGSFMQV